MLMNCVIAFESVFSGLFFELVLFLCDDSLLCLSLFQVELTNIQKKYYRAIMERNFSFLCKGASSTNTPNLMNVMMELRKCCNHPFLIKGAEEAILDELKESTVSPSLCQSVIFAYPMLF